MSSCEFAYSDDSASVSDDDIDSFSPLSSARLQSRPAYKVVDERGLFTLRREVMDKVKSILGVSENEAEGLLGHKKWDSDAAVTSFFENERASRVASGLIDPDNDPDREKLASTSSERTSTISSCGICFESLSPAKSKSVGCGHAFCQECWQGYLSHKVDDGLMCSDIRCPHPKCPIRVPEAMTRRILEPDAGARFDSFLLKSFVEQCATLKPCVGADCNKAVMFEVAPTQPTNVECDCGSKFCWLCLKQPHTPIACDIVSKWILKNTSEAENANWILSHTRPCPKCRRPVEKNGGCMHIHCTQCQHHFCWICFDNWSTHHGTNAYRCNRYKPASEDERRRKVAKESLERYTFYFERFNSHDDAHQKAEACLKSFIETKLELLAVLQRTTIQQLTFLMVAMKQIAECRRVLKWTYAYAFYECEENTRKKAFFEYIQGDMESGLERLTHMVEEEINPFLPPPDEDEELLAQQTVSSLKGPASDAIAAVNDAAAALVEKNKREYRYPVEEQEAIEDEFKGYSIRLLDLTTVTRNFFNTLVTELERGLLGVDNMDDRMIE